MDREVGQPEIWQAALPCPQNLARAAQPQILLGDPKAVIGALPKFQREKSRLEREWQGDIPWADLVLAALEIARPL